MENNKAFTQRILIKVSIIERAKTRPLMPRFFFGNLKIEKFPRI